jgi:transcriptional regulator with XRE-family HTH domain
MASQVPRQIKTTIGRNLKAARDERGLTQREVAHALGIDAFQVSRWELGKVRPSDETLIRLADVLGLDYVSFFSPPMEEAA